VGPWLARELASAGHTVVGTALDEAPGDAIEGGTLIAANLLSSADVDRLLAIAKADACIHLAGLSHVGDSWQDPAGALEANAVATMRLATACARAGTKRFLFVSTSEVYGIVTPEELPLRESSPTKPANPYAASKLAAERMLALVAPHAGLEVVVARPFSHTGAGQSPKFVCPGFAEQVARVKRGELDTIRHGDLSPKRDFLDVRDVVRAYRLLIEGGFAGRTFNVASGVSTPIGAVLATLLEMAGLPATVAEVDPARIRPVELPELRGDYAALRAATGWGATIPLRDTLASLLEHFASRAPVAR